MAYKEFNQDDGAFCYYATVTKDVDEEGVHVNEIEVEALPYTSEYQKGDDFPEGTAASRMWIPYISSVVGTQSYEKDGEGIKGYGLYSKPKKGSVVVVLAMKGGHSSNYQHIALGNFFTSDMMTPVLDDFSYKVGGQGSNIYDLKHFKDNDDVSRKNFAELTYYKTAHNTIIMADDVKKVYGIYNVSQEKNASDEDKEKAKKYIMLNLAGDAVNLDLKVGSFELYTDQIFMKAKSIMLHGADVNISARGQGQIVSQQGNISVLSAKSIAIGGKSISINDRAPDGKFNVELANAPDQPEFKYPPKPDPILEPPAPFCIVRSFIQINVLPSDFANFDSDKTIDLAKDVKLFFGDQDILGQEFDLTLSSNDKDRILKPLVLDQTSYVVDSTKSELVVFKDGGKINKDAFISQENGTNDDLDDKYSATAIGFNPKNYDKNRIDIVRKLFFASNAVEPAPPEEVFIHFHFLNARARDVIKVAVDNNDRVLYPAFDDRDPAAALPGDDTVGCLRIEVLADRTWGDTISDPNVLKALEEKIFDSDSAHIVEYVDIPKTLEEKDTGDLAVRIDQPSLNNVPGVVKFDIWPCSSEGVNQKAKSARELSFLKADQDNGTLSDALLAKCANFNFKKRNVNSPTHLYNKIPELADDDKISKETVVSDLKANDNIVHVYVRYVVERSLPLMFLTRKLNQNVAGDGVQNNLSANGPFPIFDHDMFDPRKEPDKKDELISNKVWILETCTDNPDKYKHLLRRKPENGETLLFVKDVEGDELDRLTTFATDSSKTYAEYATGDDNIKWNLGDYNDQVEQNKGGVNQQGFSIGLAESFKVSDYDANGQPLDNDNQQEERYDRLGYEKNSEDTFLRYDKFPFRKFQLKGEEIVDVTNAPDNNIINNNVNVDVKEEEEEIGKGIAPGNDGNVPGEAMPDADAQATTWHYSRSAPVFAGWEKLDSLKDKDNKYFGDDKNSCGGMSIDTASKYSQYAFGLVAKYAKRGEADTFVRKNVVLDNLSLDQLGLMQHGVGYYNDAIDEGVYNQGAKVVKGRLKYSHFACEEDPIDLTRDNRYRRYLKHRYYGYETIAVVPYAVAGFRSLAVNLAEAGHQDDLRRFFNFNTEKEFKGWMDGLLGNGMGIIRDTTSKFKTDFSTKHSFYGTRPINRLGDFGELISWDYYKKFIQKKENFSKKDQQLAFRNLRYFLVRRRYVTGEHIYRSGYGMPDGQRMVEKDLFGGVECRYDSYPPVEFLCVNVGPNRLINNEHQFERWKRRHCIDNVTKIPSMTGLSGFIKRNFSTSDWSVNEAGRDPCTMAEQGDSIPASSVNTAVYDIGYSKITRPAIFNAKFRGEEIGYDEYPCDIFARLSGDADDNEARAWIKAHWIGDLARNENVNVTGSDIVDYMKCLGMYLSSKDEDLITAKVNGRVPRYIRYPVWAHEAPSYSYFGWSWWNFFSKFNRVKEDDVRDKYDGRLAHAFNNDTGAPTWKKSVHECVEEYINDSRIRI